MRILLTRPRADSDALAEMLAEAGIDSLVAPMLDIVLRDADRPLALDGVQALLATSANGVRALAERTDRRDLPLLAVGEATASCARAAGFSDVHAAGGDSERLAALAKERLDPSKGAVLHAAGAHVAGDLDGALTAAGFDCRREVLYEAVAAASLADEVRAALREGALDGVALFSPRSARIFTDLVRAAGEQDALRRLVAYCLGSEVAGSARRELWRRVVVSGHPTAESLVDLMRADLPSPKRGRFGFAQAGRPRAAPTAMARAAPASEARWRWPGVGAGWRSAAAAAAVALVVSLAVLVVLGPWVVRGRLPAPAPASEPGPDAALAPRLDAVERRLENVAERAAAGVDARDRLAARIDALPPAASPAEVATLRSELARSLEDAAAQARRLDGLAGEVAALREQVAAFGANAEALADRLARADAGGAARRAGALLIALGQLRAALADGAPYRDELESLRALAAGERAFEAPLDRLAGSAATGIAGEAELAARFPEMAVAALADDRPADAGWLRQALGEVESLISVRRIGAGVAGDDAEAVLARAEARLEAGDLAGAVAMLDALAPAPAAAAEWRERAHAHLDAHAALDDLTSLVLTRAEEAGPGAP